MTARRIKRSSITPLIGLAFGTLILGDAFAQAPAPQAGPASSASATPVPLSPASIFGIWSNSPECRLEDEMIIISPRFMLIISATRSQRAAVTYEAATDGIVVTAARTITRGNAGNWIAGQTDSVSAVLARRDNTLRFVRRIGPTGQSTAPDPEDARPFHLCG